jgi:hypothetical protein
VLALPRSAAAQHNARHVLRGVRPFARARGRRAAGPLRPRQIARRAPRIRPQISAVCRWVARQLARRPRARPQAARRVAARDGALLHGFARGGGAGARRGVRRPHRRLCRRRRHDARVARFAAAATDVRAAARRGAAQRLRADDVARPRPLVPASRRRVDVQPRLRPVGPRGVRYQPRGRVCGGARYAGGRRAVHLVCGHESALRGAAAGAAAAVWVRHRLWFTNFAAR